MAEVLLVEDNEDLASLMRILLETEGYLVRMAKNGQEGLREIGIRHPDVVLMDVWMPVLDGPGMLYRMFLENAGRENVPVVLVSAIPDLVEVARKLGTPYLLPKPFEIEALLAVVQRALTERIIPRPEL